MSHGPRHTGAVGDVTPHLKITSLCTAIWLLSGCADPSYLTPRKEVDAAQVGPDAQGATGAQPDGSTGSAPVSAAADSTRRDDGGSGPRPPASSAGNASATDAAASTAEAPATGTDAAVTMPGPTATTADDAATPVVPPEVLPMANAPAWASQLRGHYAIQSTAFQEVNNVVTRIQELRLGEIAQVGDRLQLTSRLCKHLESNRLGTLNVVAPDTLPPRRELLAFEGDTFSATPIDVAVGYDSAPPSECAGKVGQRVPKRELQTWIKGTDCACVASGRPANDDCRVLDPEHDNQPGFTAHAEFVTGPADVYGVFERFSTLVAGVAQSDGRHRGEIMWRDRYYQLGCSLADCLDLSTEAKGCPTMRNPVRFAPLDRLEQPASGWTCEQLLAQAAALFPGAAPVAPTGCP